METNEIETLKTAIMEDERVFELTAEAYQDKWLATAYFVPMPYMNGAAP